MSTRVTEPMAHSLAILQKHYKLSSLKIVLILKTISQSEYIIAQADQ